MPKIRGILIMKLLPTVHGRYQCSRQISKVEFLNAISRLKIMVIICLLLKRFLRKTIVRIPELFNNNSILSYATFCNFSTQKAIEVFLRNSMYY